MDDQIFLYECCVCKTVYGCYSSYRFMNDRRRQCVNDAGRQCTAICPIPNRPSSHGFCEKHFQEAMKRIQEREKKMENKDA